MSEVIHDLAPINWFLSYEEMSELHFKRLEECDDDNLGRLELQAHIQEDPRRAILLCRIRLGRNIDNLIAWVHLAAAYERLGKFKKAYEVYVEHVTRLSGKLERNELVIKRLKLKIGDPYFPRKYEAFKKDFSDKITELHISTLIMYSVQAETVGDWESVMFFNDEMLKRNPHNIVSLTRKASAFRRLGRLKEALEIFEKIFELQKVKGLNISRTLANVSQIQAELDGQQVELVSSGVRRGIADLVKSK